MPGSDPETKARRCSVCDEDWPMSTNYKRCPTCTRDTWEATRTQPMTEVEAREVIAAHEARTRRRADLTEAVIQYEIANLDSEWAAFAV